MTHSNARSFSPEDQETLRQRVVRMVLDGMTQSGAARHVGVARQTVNKWMQRYRAGGAKALQARPRGRHKNGTLLKSWQAAQIVRAIVDTTPDRLRLPYVLWMREAVGALIEQRFDVHPSPVIVGRWLGHWGLRPRKPIPQAWEKNPKQAAHWFKVEHPRLRREAKAEGAEIQWGAEQAGATIERKGRTMFVPGPGRRGGCKMIFSVSGRGTSRFMFFKQRYTAKVLIEFMRRLVRSVGRKVCLVVEGHPAQKSPEVAQWLERHKKQIRLIHVAGQQSAA